jgi:hypothetical protein
MVITYKTPAEKISSVVDYPGQFWMQLLWLRWSIFSARQHHGDCDLIIRFFFHHAMMQKELVLIF